MVTTGVVTTGVVTTGAVTTGAVMTSSPLEGVSGFWITEGSVGNFLRLSLYFEEVFPSMIF